MDEAQLDGGMAICAPIAPYESISADVRRAIAGAAGVNYRSVHRDYRPRWMKAAVLVTVWLIVLKLL